MQDGCIFWGIRAIVPLQLEKMLNTLHKGHVGVVRMKALARSHVWWSGVDIDV